MNPVERLVELAKRSADPGMDKACREALAFVERGIEAMKSAEPHCDDTSAHAGVSDWLDEARERWWVDTGEPLGDTSWFTQLCEERDIKPLFHFRDKLTIQDKPDMESTLDITFRRDDELPATPTD